MGAAGAEQGGGAAGQGGTQCYSPTENLDLAYDPAILGCTCIDGDSVCISSVALICESSRWQAVEDGPCMPIERECEDRVETIYQCLNWFSECVQEDAGYFCGYGRKTNMCSAGYFVPSAGDCWMDDAFCQELTDGSYCTGVSSTTCPEGWEGSPYCQYPLLTSDECMALHGLVAGDPGDGSLLATGCEDGLTTYARVSGCEEGCLCCLGSYIGP